MLREITVKKFLYQLLIEPTDKLILQMLRYCFVGGIAFIADNGSYLLLVKMGCHYMAGAVIAFFIGLAVNYLLSKLLVFKMENARTGAISEFAIYALIGAVGLGITEVLLWLQVEVLGFNEIIAKLAASVITLIWNFAARKIILYRRK